MQAKSSNKDCIRCLLNLSNLYFIWSSLTTAKFIYYWFWTSYEICVSLKYLFHFLSTNDWLHSFIKVLKSNCMEIQRFKHGSNKFFFVCCRLLGWNFNGNLLCQGGLDKHFSESFLLVIVNKIFFLLEILLDILKKGLYHAPSNQTYNISMNSSCLVPV